MHVVVVPNPLKAVAEFDLSACCTYYDGHKVVTFFSRKIKQASTWVR